MLYWVLVLDRMTTRLSIDHLSLPAYRMVLRFSHATRVTRSSTVHLGGTHRASHSCNGTHTEHPGPQKGMGAGWECGSSSSASREMLHTVAVLPVSTSPHHMRFHINCGFARNKTSLFLLRTAREPQTKFPLFDLCKSANHFYPRSLPPLQPPLPLLCTENSR